MPIILYLRTFGYVETNISKYLNDSILDQGDRMTASYFDRESWTCKVIETLGSHILSTEFFFKFINLCLSFAFEFVDYLSEILLFFFGYFLELRKKVIEQPLFTKVFYTELF